PGPDRPGRPRQADGHRVRLPAGRAAGVRTAPSGTRLTGPGRIEPVHESTDACLTTLCDRTPSPVRVRTLAGARARRAWPRLGSLLGVSIERREFLLLGG